MKIYQSSKKYLRFVIPAVIIAGAIVVPKARHGAKTETLGDTTAGNRQSISVSPSGRQPYTNVTADSLQAAAAPERSATSAGLNPQPAAPNYCRPGETPIIDGCITN